MAVPLITRGLSIFNAKSRTNSAPSAASCIPNKDAVYQLIKNIRALLGCLYQIFVRHFEMSAQILNMFLKSDRSIIEILRIVILRNSEKH